MSKRLPVDRATSFGSVAELYERFREGYPAEVVDVIERHARRPVRSALEVGAGTGKATRVIAGRGVSVQALEPDPAMARVLTANIQGLPARAVITTFERFRTDDHFDLVYAAAAWHWVDPAVRWRRAVDLLSPGGVLALFGSPCHLADDQLRAAVESLEQQVLPPASSGGTHWSLEDVAATPGLVEATQADLAATSTITAERFVGRLTTLSSYVVLSADVRADLLGQIRAVLPDPVTIDATLRLCVARRE